MGEVVISDFRLQSSERISDFRFRISDVIARRAKGPTWQSDEVVLSKAEGVVEGSLAYWLKRDCFPFDPFDKLRAGKLRVATTSEIANLKFALIMVGGDGFAG